MIAACAANQHTPIRDGDVIVVTQKVVSKAEGMLVDLSTIEPSPFAKELAEHAGKNARLIELVLRESRSIVRMEPDRGIIIAETKHGFVCANAGIDSSNVYGDNIVCLLPVDPDASARRIMAAISASTGVQRIAVIVSDTFGRAWREGHVNFAIGIAGMEPMRDYRGEIDAAGKMLHVTTIATADEIAAAAEMVNGKYDNVPAAIVRGFEFAPGEGGITPLLRHRSRDLFR
jgi:coenzyme F420-0:L-glutamate ligase/coenzyme F420-1:gamma-L-glutamate ligase